MIYNCISILLTIASSIIALMPDTQIEIKLIAITIAIFSGIFSLILSWHNYEDSEYSKRMLESIIKTLAPKEEMYEFIHNKVLKEIRKDITGKALIFNGGDYIWIENQEDTIDFAFLIESSDIMKLYVTPEKILKKTINEKFISKWTKNEDIESDWNLIVHKVDTYINSALRALKYSEIYHHLGFMINYDNKSIGFILYDKTDNIIFESNLFDCDGLKDFLNIAPINRFTFITKRINQIIRDNQVLSTVY